MEVIVIVLIYVLLYFYMLGLVLFSEDLERGGAERFAIWEPRSWLLLGRRQDIHWCKSTCGRRVGVIVIELLAFDRRN